MNKMNKKGFTIVELVIVIAVIAILAGVLIPTFGGIIDRANESAALQEAANAYKAAYIEAMADGKIDETSIKKDGYVFGFTNGVLTSVTEDKAEGVAQEYEYTVSNGTITAAEKK